MTLGLRVEGLVVDAEPLRRTQREAVDDDVGRLCQCVELPSSLVALQIQDGTALPSVPDPIAGLLRKGIPEWGLDPGDLGTVVRQEHRRHRTGNAP